jgi:hypothetical protein
MSSFNTTADVSSSERTVVGMHFVCRDDRNVMDDGNGVFVTGSWKVSPRHAETVEYVALHTSRSDPSYRQGRVVAYYRHPREQDRFVLVASADDQPRDWQGDGTGEKGYLWRG